MTMFKCLLPYLLLVLFMQLSCAHKDSSIRLAEDLPVKYIKKPGLDTFAANKAKNGIPLWHKSKFQMASCTKSFTALLVAIFIEKEKISWDTSLSSVFPEMVIHPSNRGITVLQLLSHQSGLLQFWTDEEVFEIDSMIPGLTGDIIEKRERFTAWNLARAPAFAKGEYHYSNGGFVVLASILERITGKSYEDLISAHILTPLHLQTAEFGYAFLEDERQPHRHMSRDLDGKGIALAAHARNPPDLFNPCGFLSMSIDDFALYLKFNIEMLNKDSALLSRKTFNLLFKSYHILPNGSGVGLGWQIIEINGIKTFGHTGSDQTMRSGMAINPRNKKGVVFLTNIGDHPSEQALVNVIHELIY